MCFNYMNNRFVVLLLLFLLLFPSTLPGDEIHLKNGNVIKGKVMHGNFMEHYKPNIEVNLINRENSFWGINEISIPRKAISHIVNEETGEKILFNTEKNSEKKNKEHCIFSSLIMNVFLGYLFPTGNNKILGNKWLLNSLFGLNFGIVNIYTDFSFGLQTKSDKTYYVEKNDTLYATDTSDYTHLGLTVSIHIYQWKNIAFEIQGGIGFDDIEPLDEDEHKEEHSIYSRNINTGAIIKYYLKREAYQTGTIYWIFRGRYDFIDYKNPKGTDLSGNNFQINIGIGMGAR